MRILITTAAILGTPGAALGTPGAAAAAQAPQTEWSQKHLSTTYTVTKPGDNSCSMAVLDGTRGFYFNQTKSGESRFIVSNDTAWFDGSAPRELRINYSANFEFGVERLTFARMRDKGETAAIGFESKGFGKFYEKLSGGQSIMIGENGTPAYFQILLNGEAMTQAVSRYTDCIAKL